MPPQSDEQDFGASPLCSSHLLPVLFPPSLVLFSHARTVEQRQRHPRRARARRSQRRTTRPFPRERGRAGASPASGEGRLNRCFFFPSTLKTSPLLLSLRSRPLASNLLLLQLTVPLARAPSLSLSLSLSLSPPVPVPPPKKKNARSASTAPPRTPPGPRSPTASSSASRAPGRTAPWGSTCRSCARPRSTPGAPTSSG